MEKTISILRTIANSILAVGLFGMLNESESFIPNIVGAACFICLIYLNKNRDGSR